MSVKLSVSLEYEYELKMESLDDMDDAEPGLLPKTALWRVTSDSS